MNTTTTTAAAEAAKNLAIYNAVADYARHAFEYLNIKPGQYTPAQIVAELKKYRAAWKDNAPAVGDEGGLVRVAVDAFACSFPLLSAFDVLAQLATAYDIPTRDRVTFERAAETAPAVVSFMVPTAAADVAKAVAKKAPDREALTFAYIDTERRALVGTDGHVLTVAAVPSLQVAEGARHGYLVARGLLKADRVTIDTNNNATDGHNVAESPDWLRFPVWSSVFPDVYDTDALTIDNATRRALAKAVAAAAKYATPDLKDTRHVVIFGEACTDRLTVRARREIATPTAEDPHAVKYEYMDTAVQLPATLSRSLAFAFHGPDFATLPAFDTLYITPNEGRAAVVISRRAAAVLVPQPLPDGYDRICTTDERPAFAVQLHPLADLLDIYTDAPDTLTAAAAADGHQDTDTTTTTPAEVISEPTTTTTAAEVISEDTTTTPAEVISESESEPTAAAPAADGHQDTPAAVVAAADMLARADVRAAAKAIAKAKPDKATDTDRRDAFEARRLLTREGLTLTDYKIKTADGLTLCRFIYSYGKKSRRTLCAPLLKVAAEFATLSDLLAEFAELMTISESESQDTPAEVISEPTESEPTAAAPAADDSQDTPAEWCPLTGQYLTPADHLTPDEIRALVAAERERLADTDTTTTTPAEVISEDTPAEVISESESEADALPVTFYDPAAGVIVWGLADELPTADGLTAESVTAADLLTIESERESAAHADGHQDTTTTAHDSESRPRALLLTITRAALRLAAVVAALLLLTFANDRPTPATATTTAADLLAPADHQDTAAEVISESESADTLTTTPAEVISEPTESEPTAAPAADRPAVEKRHHGRENKRESRAELLTIDTTTADSLAAAPADGHQDTTTPAVVISESESADTTTARPLLTADELADLLALLTGTTTAESATAAPAADDSQDTPAEVISEPTESEPTAAPADGHQDTPATTGTTTPAAPAAGCPAAVATPCPPAAPVAPVAPIIL